MAKKMDPVYRENRDYISVDVMGTICSRPQKKGFRIKNVRGKEELVLAVFLSPDVQEEYADAFREGDYVFITKAGLFLRGNVCCLTVAPGSAISLVKRNNDLGSAELEKFI